MFQKQFPPVIYLKTKSVFVFLYLSIFSPVNENEKILNIVIRKIIILKQVLQFFSDQALPASQGCCYHPCQIDQAKLARWKNFVFIISKRALGGWWGRCRNKNILISIPSNTWSVLLYKIFNAITYLIRRSMKTHSRTCSIIYSKSISLLHF